ncbi:HNH endonuclease [Chthoniobacter flavus Ellin428]|uniref:HNH endonuclease n=1 Tax=Chthoniobacter flavus Ellin428 TaxID=497964 RepID=B4DBZ0_9BACT|nr:HNH endonuclease signature motif containing protein [Chthoniobacter flavus]EDY16037.1 HNH endonuclease [Chthoniobacter flavus Ellin428]
MARRVIPQPYVFPDGPHARRHGPKGWKDYGRYRQWLRDEFCFRCVYCLMREQWVDMRRGFQIDHFVARKIRPDLKADYDNLIYLCPSCNNLKRASRLPDPCHVALAQCLRFKGDGNVEALNADGEMIIETLELDDPRLVEFRRRKIGILRSLAADNWALFVEEMRFPTDIPDLTQENPPENTRPDGYRPKLAR